MPTPATPGLPRINSLPADELAPELLACLDVPRWADDIIRQRPFATADPPLPSSGHRRPRAHPRRDPPRAGRAPAHRRTPVGEVEHRSLVAHRAVRCGPSRRAADATAARGERRVRAPIRPRLPRLRQRPQRRGTAGDPALPIGQRPGDRNGRGRRRTAQDRAAATDEGDCSNERRHHARAGRGRGTPAAGITVRLEQNDGAGWTAIAEATTDADGRIRDLGPDPLTAGDYRLTFETGAYFAAAGVETFYPQVQIAFRDHRSGRSTTTCRCC